MQRQWTPLVWIGTSLEDMHFVVNYVINYVTIRATCNSGVLNNKEDQVFTSLLLSCRNSCNNGARTRIAIKCRRYKPKKNQSKQPAKGIVYKILKKQKNTWP